MTVSLIQDWTALARLAADWQRLHEADPGASIFTTWEWMDAWRQVTGGEPRPYVLVARNEAGTPVAILPLWRSQMRLPGGIRWRTLRFLGDTATGAEYPDIIAAADHGQLLTTLLAALRRDNASWDVLYLPRMAGWDGVAERWQAALRTAGLSWRERWKAFSAFDLPATLDDFEAGFSASHRQQLRRNSRKIGKQEGVATGACNEARDLAPDLAALFDLHQRAWEARGEPGAFRRRPAMADFYRAFAPVAAARGWLALYHLQQSGTYRAVQYGYRFRGTYLQLQEGFDPEFLAGAGNALRHFAIGDLIAQGTRHYDFLCGDSEHKRRWGGQHREGPDLMIYNRRLRTLPLVLRPLWPGGRLLHDDADDEITAANARSQA